MVLVLAWVATVLGWDVQRERAVEAHLHPRADLTLALAKGVVSVPLVAVAWARRAWRHRIVHGLCPRSGPGVDSQDSDTAA